MSTQSPVETTLELTDTEQQLGHVVDRVAGGEARVVLEQRGLPVAAIISIDDYRRFREADARRDARFEAIGRISDAFAAVPVEELERRVERALTANRSQRRREAASAAS